MTSPFHIAVDGRSIDQPLASIQGNTMRVTLRPWDQWGTAEIGLHLVRMPRIVVFATPRSKYQDIGVQAWELAVAGTKLKLGPFSGIIAEGTQLDIPLAPGYYYDIFCLGYQTGGFGWPLKRSRCTTIGRSLPRPEDAKITFEQAQYLAATALALSLDAASQTEVEIEVLEFEDPEHRGESQPPLVAAAGFIVTRLMRGREVGVVIDQYGRLSYYKGDSPEQIRKYMEDQR